MEKKLLARDCVIYQVCYIGTDQWSKMDIYENMLGEVTWQLLIVMQNLCWKTSKHEDIYKLGSNRW